MPTGRTVLGQGPAMFERAVSLVTVPAVERRFVVQFAHQGVTSDLGENRGRTNRGAALVSLDNRHHRQFCPLQFRRRFAKTHDRRRSQEVKRPIDQGALGPQRQRTQCPLGRDGQCDTQPPLVNLVRRGDADRGRTRPALDERDQSFAFTGREHFGVGESGWCITQRVQHDGPDHQWSGEGPASDFVDAHHRTAAEGDGLVLERGHHPTRVPTNAPS